MTLNKILALTLLVLFVLSENILAQNSGRVYRRSGVLNANQVRTVFGNWGVIGQPSTAGPRGAWIFDTNGYVGDVSPLVGAQVQGKYFLGESVRDTVFNWVIDVPVSRPSRGGFDNSINGDRQAFEPVRGYFNESQGQPAISSNSNTWPSSWPNRSPEFDGFWNGLFGKLPSAELETYFVLDDDNDNEFSTAVENASNIFFQPDTSDPTRQGLGLEMEVRGLQWQQILAQDNIFWVYEITNKSDFTYNRTVFGMLVGTYVGVTAGDDSPMEYDDDWSFFDVNEDLTYTGDFPNNNSRNPFWQGAVGLVGYAFLESPGNPFDGIDNDNDADIGAVVPVADFFSESDFQNTTIVNSPTPGSGERNTVVVSEDITIDGKKFLQRSTIVFPADQDTLIVTSMGITFKLIAGETVLNEGNVIGSSGSETVNANAFDGFDNDLDGLVDENYFLHYRQRRVTPDGRELFNILNPVRRVDYISGQGIGDDMIDERRDDLIDNDQDWSRNPETGELLFDDEGILLDDVGVDGVPKTFDFGENDGNPTTGEPNFDDTDKDESDQIGLSNFDYFVPSGDIAMGDDQEMWGRMQPGFFDVPESFVNGRPTQGEDGDFVYSSGYFPLTQGQTERMSLALIFSFELDDMIKKLQTVRKIYDSDYRFPIAPDKPTVTAVAGNNQVTLYWNRRAESSFDPVLREFDFEGYKIYKATDINFNDARVITNSAGNVVAFKAIEQYDLIDEISGWFFPPYDVYQILDGWSFFLGDETGLVHSYVDTDVLNGRTYYYAIVSYDKGVDSTGVLPAECTKKITITNTGELIYDINTVGLVPAAASAGYQAPAAKGELNHDAGDGFGTVEFEILDETVLTGHEYEVYFWDTSNDGLDNNNNGLIDEEDPEELESVTTRYAVQDLYEYKEDWVPDDTNWVDLSRANLVEESVLVQDGVGNVIPDSLYEVNYEEGQIRALDPEFFKEILPAVAYMYHPIYFSPYMQGSPWVSQELSDTDIFDGVTLNFDNIWRTSAETVASSWNDSTINYTFEFAFEPSQLPDGTILLPVYFPSNYELRIYDHVVDTTTSYFEEYGILLPSPRKFEIYNTTGDYKIEYFHSDNDGDMWPSLNERIGFFERDSEGNFVIFTWQFFLTLSDPTEDPYVFEGGEILFLVSKFPFNKFDLFSLMTEIPKVDADTAKTDLDNIRVFPNPYIVAHPFEAPLPPNVTAGRGERIIFFTHLPANSKVHIFTSRGEHLRTLENDNPIQSGQITWDLKSKENLDIAFGVYFYVVESDVGMKRGKLAVIK
jgi:hypothetical protein